MFSDPAQNVAAFGLTEGMRVVEFGAGSGAYTLAMAERVGSTGKVYAIDVQSELLSRLDNLVKEKRRSNIEIVRANIERQGGSGLADNLADVVLLTNVLFQSDAKYSMVLEAKRVLRPGGQAIIIDWQGSFSQLGPTPEQVIKPEEAKQIFDQAGLKFDRDFSAGDHHYGMIFNKQS
ncbi:MAG: methyltransferase domain-containing protein [Patescibacteria group bacterium]|nr:methyltransferase domain-containing protein [Patescibacteria group bacterium]